MTDESPPPPILQLTPLNPAFRDDPHAIYRRLRESHAAYRDEMAGSTIITRYKIVRETLNDRTMLRGPDKVDPPGPFTQRLVESFERDPETGEPRTNSILLMDEPHHSRVRPPIAKALYARAAKCKPLVDEIIDEKFDAVEPNGGFDLLNEFAIPLPIDVIGAILGVDTERRGEFREWSEGVIQVLNPFRTPAQTDVFAAVRRSDSCVLREPNRGAAEQAARRSDHRRRAVAGRRRRSQRTQRSSRT